MVPPFNTPLGATRTQSPDPLSLRKTSVHLEMKEAELFTVFSQNYPGSLEILEKDGGWHRVDKELAMH